MSEIRVFTIPGSPFARAVMVLLEEKAVPYRVQALSPVELQSEAHRARHAFNRMPAVKHGGFWLYETQAILRYIDRAFPRPAFTPADLYAAARMDQLMNINDWYLFHGVNNVIGFERVVKPMVLGQAADERAIAAAMPAAQRVMAELAHLLGGKPFLAGEAPTLADVLIGPQLDFLAHTPEWAALSAGHASLAEWLARMNARESFRATTLERVLAAASGTPEPAMATAGDTLPD